MATIHQDEIGPELHAIANLIGILNQDEFQPEWFSNPVAELAHMPGRVTHLLSLLDLFLGSKASGEPPIFPGVRWYPIPDPLDGSPMALYLVTPPPTATHGEVGIGFLYPFYIGNLTINTYAFVPLFQLNENEEPAFILAARPTKFGLNVSSGEEIHPANGGSFTDMLMEVDFCFSDNFDLFDFNIQFKDNDRTLDEFDSVSALLGSDDAIDRIGELIVHGSYWLYLYIGDSPYTIGDILVKANLLATDDDGRTYHFDKNKLAPLLGDPIKAVKDLTFTILDILAESQEPLISVKGGGIWIVNEKQSYGVRVCIADILLGAGTRQVGEQTKPAPEIRIHLGKWLTEETNDNSWTNQLTGERHQPGLSMFLLNHNGNNITLAPSLQLTSIGVDIQGGQNRPLIDLQGYALQRIELRMYLDGRENWNFGVATRLDEIGLPLGGSLVPHGGSNNPVVQNLLASGDNSDGPAPIPGKSDDVNPTFSIKAAYLNQNAQNQPDYLVQLCPPSGSAEGIVWFPVQRQFGPLVCQRFGVVIDTSNKSNPVLAFLFDGGVHVAVLEVNLIHLLVGLPLGHLGNIDNYQFELDGLDIYFNNGLVEISGGFLKNDIITEEHPFISYDGFALLKFKQYSLSAFGSYGVLDNHPSMFIFAMLTGHIGGPPIFHVTGIAAGFGYNRDLRVPSEAQDILDFPLIALLPDPTSSGSEEQPAHDLVLKELSDYIPPRRGEYWLAAGLQFTSFDIIYGDILLVIKFGQEFEIDLLGVARTRLPQTGPTYVYAELGLLASFNPAHGLLMVKAALTSNSYLIDPKCQLTGGFAFVTWFQPNDHAGDFVLTLGGYHPSFVLPSHYPKVDRLGFNWHCSDTITISGEAYFALTPSAIMAGGRLDLAFHSTSLRAWANAHIDIIIFWKPFYLEARAGISIGLSFRLDLDFIHVIFTLALSVELEVWGPPTGGKAHIDWSFISFTISFGAAKDIDTSPTMNWDGFKTMLPQTQKRKEAVVERSSTSSPDKEAVILSINAGEGVDRVTEDGRWLIRPQNFSFTVQTAMPVNQVFLSGATKSESGRTVGIRPMGIAELNSQMTISIKKSNDEQSQPLANWDYTLLKRRMPAAMWGQPLDGLPKAVEIISDCLVGLECIHLVAHSPLTGTDAFDAKNVFDYLRLETAVAYPEATNLAQKGKAFFRHFLPLDATVTQPATGAPNIVKDYTAVKKINETNVLEQRQALFQALAELGTDAATNDNMNHMAENPIGDLFGIPMIKHPSAKRVKTRIEDNYPEELGR